METFFAFAAAGCSFLSVVQSDRASLTARVRPALTPFEIGLPSRRGPVFPIRVAIENVGVAREKIGVVQFEDLQVVGDFGPTAL